MNYGSHSRELLNMARKDLSALRGMENRVVFADEIFGFHVQQAAEKALKAWIDSLDLDYPLTHNIAVLLEVLEKRGIDVSCFTSLVDFNPFDVQFRYIEVSGLEGQLDRDVAIASIVHLIELVESKIRD